MQISSKQPVRLSQFTSGRVAREKAHFSLSLYAKKTVWIQSIIVINLEERRKDYHQMFAHHIITVLLMSTSYTMNYTRVGNAILCTMDLVDIILPVRPPLSLPLPLLLRTLAHSLTHSTPTLPTAGKTLQIHQSTKTSRLHFWNLSPVLDPNSSYRFRENHLERLCSSASTSSLWLETSRRIFSKSKESCRFLYVVGRVAGFDVPLVVVE